MPAECVDLIFTDPPYYQHRAQDLLVTKNNGKPRNIVVNKFEFDDFESEEAYLDFMNEVNKEYCEMIQTRFDEFLEQNKDYIGEKPQIQTI